MTHKRIPTGNHAWAIFSPVAAEFQSSNDATRPATDVAKKGPQMTLVFEEKKTKTWGQQEKKTRTRSSKKRWFSCKPLAPMNKKEENPKTKNRKTTRSREALIARFLPVCWSAAWVMSWEAQLAGVGEELMKSHGVLLRKNVVLVGENRKTSYEKYLNIFNSLAFSWLLGDISRPVLGSLALVVVEARRLRIEASVFTMPLEGFLVDHWDKGWDEGIRAMEWEDCRPPSMLQPTPACVALLQAIFFIS